MAGPQTVSNFQLKRVLLDSNSGQAPASGGRGIADKGIHMSNSIRIIMADDSAAVRQMVSSTLAKRHDIEVLGVARNGREAISLIAQDKPDIVLLDVEMPIMDGIDTLKQIRRTDRKTPVLMFSSLTVKGGEATLDALSCGASDYVAKPTGMTTPQQAIDYLNAELVPKIRLLVTHRANGSSHTTRAAAVRPFSMPVARKATHPGDVDVIAIGASTGGPNALADIISKLPADLGVPVLIVQHMPPLFTKLLAERLDRISGLNVTEARHGSVIRPGQVFVAPGDQHMLIRRDKCEYRVELSDAAPENSCRPAVDVLFRSVAEVCGERSLGVVLTGMGRDGTEGCRRLSKRGAAVLAQDQASCVVWGMPRAVAEEGLAHKILPLSEIASEMKRYAQRSSPSVCATVH